MQSVKMKIKNLVAIEYSNTYYVRIQHITNHRVTIYKFNHFKDMISKEVSQSVHRMTFDINNLFGSNIAIDFWRNIFT